MVDWLEAHLWIGVILCILLALADAWTTREVISKGKGREGNWIPAKLVERFGLTKYLIGSRLLIFAGLWVEPMGGWVLAPVQLWAVWNNYRNMG